MRRKEILWIVNSNGCFICTSHSSNSKKSLYPVSFENGKKKLISRMVYEKEKGKIPADLCVLHKCDNPLCINIRHLFLGTKKENNEDRDRKGRSGRGVKNRHAKLTEQEVLLIRKMPGTIQSIANIFSVQNSTISYIKRKITWKHL